MKWEELLPLITGSWCYSSDATELGIPKSPLKAPTSTLRYFKMHTEQLHSSAHRVCLGWLGGKAHTCEHPRDDSLLSVQTQSASHTASNSVACRQEILLKHFWKSQSHNLLADLLLPFIHPLLDLHTSQPPPHTTFFQFLSHYTPLGTAGKKEEKQVEGMQRGRVKERKTKHNLFSLGNHMMLK